MNEDNNITIHKENENQLPEEGGWVEWSTKVNEWLVFPPRAIIDQ